MIHNSNHIVIMAGGVGSRFWPMSTVSKPKQFIDVLGVGKSLLQLTYDRFKGITRPENIWIVTNEKYVDIVCQQLPNVPISNISPCIAYVSFKIKHTDPRANIIVTPSDHIVTDLDEFKRIVTKCLEFTSETDAIKEKEKNGKELRKERIR